MAIESRDYLASLVMDKIVRLENVGEVRKTAVRRVRRRHESSFRYDRVRVCGCVYGVVRDAR
jgi:uncharacterized NAD(P)/FAD-binding protein YdhS